MTCINHDKKFSQKVYDGWCNLNRNTNFRSIEHKHAEFEYWLSTNSIFMKDYLYLYANNEEMMTWFTLTEPWNKVYEQPSNK